MANRVLKIKGDTVYETEAVTSLLFQDNVEIELPDNCELRNTDEVGKYKIIVVDNEWNKALDELVGKMKREYLHRVGTQFDNAILEMEKFAKRLKR